MKKFFIFFLALNFSTFANVNLSVAQFVTGNDLYRWCNSANDKDSCYAYILGVLDNNDILNFWAGECFLFNKAPNVSGQQLVDIVIKGMKDNPKDRNLSAASLALTYLSTAFPCTSKEKK